MKLVFNERKAAQAAAYLLRKHGTPMHAHHLMFMLYMADRQSLIENGYTITGDQMVMVPDEEWDEEDENAIGG